MISEKTPRDGLSKETICEIIEVEKIEKFVKEQRTAMVWAHEKNGYKRAPVKQKKKIVVDGSKKSRPKKHKSC